MRTNSEWLRHFDSNRDSLLAIPWDEGAELSSAERNLVGRSIAEFQRGESSEGRHLISYADAYARAAGDDAYAGAIRLFIAEEQRHARDLARFLAINRLPLVGHSVVDALFRRLRNLFGTLEVSIAILILAEIIAQVYYRALRDATRSRILTRLCDQVLRDEAEHVRFQAQQLGRLRATRNRVLYLGTMLAQRLVFATTCGVVWMSPHRRVLRRGGYDAARFWASAWQHFDAAFLVSHEARNACRSEPDSAFVESPRRSAAACRVNG